MKKIQIFPWIANSFVILLSVFFIAFVVYGATTIGDNVNTDGNLDVNGRASTTNATTTGYLYVGADITEPTGWDFNIGDLIVTDDAFFNSQATTSASLWVGSGGTADNIDVAGGDLYVQNDAEIDGSLYTGNTLITGRATTTANFVAGGSNTSATTTITLGSNTGAAGAGVCFRIRQDAGWIFCYVSGTAFTCGATSCE